MDGQKQTYEQFKTDILPVEGRAQGRIPPLRENDGGRERGAVPCRMPCHIQTTARHQKGMADVMV